MKVYNQFIQTYFYFPEVIICGSSRLEKEEFDLLLSHHFIIAYYTDSFGKLYRLSKKGEAFLHESLSMRKYKAPVRKKTAIQINIPFC